MACLAVADQEDPPYCDIEDCPYCAFGSTIGLAACGDATLGCAAAHCSMNTGCKACPAGSLLIEACLGVRICVPEQVGTCVWHAAAGCLQLCARLSPGRIVPHRSCPATGCRSWLARPAPAGTWWGAAPAPQAECACPCAPPASGPRLAASPPRNSSARAPSRPAWDAPPARRGATWHPSTTTTSGPAWPPPARPAATGLPLLLGWQAPGTLTTSPACAGAQAAPTCTVRPAGARPAGCAPPARLNSRCTKVRGC